VIEIQHKFTAEQTKQCGPLAAERLLTRVGDSGGVQNGSRLVSDYPADVHPSITLRRTNVRGQHERNTVGYPTYREHAASRRQLLQVPA